MPESLLTIGGPREIARVLALAAARVGLLRGLGGKGSGNFGHKGRPGEVGGSSPSIDTDAQGTLQWRTDDVGNTSIAGINEQQWVDWAHESNNINDLLAGESVTYDSIGGKLSETSIQELKRTGEQIQEAAFTHAVTTELWRGESYATVEEVLEKYKRNSTVTFDRLTAGGVTPDVAVQYATSMAETGDPNFAVPVVLRISRNGGTLGIQTIPMGVPSGEVVMPKGESFRVSGIAKPGSPRYDDASRELFGIPKNAIIVELYNKTPAPKSVKRYRPWVPKTLGGPGSGNFGHAGRPGQVGGSSDGVGLPLEQAAFVQKFDMQAIPPGAMHRIMINPRTGMMILSKMHSDPGSNDAMDETHSGVYSDALGGDSEGFRQTGFDDYYRGFITGPEPGFPKGRLELMNPANYEVDPEDITEDDIAQESDAVASIVSQLVKNGGLKRETLIEGLHPVVQESLPFMFPSARKRALGGPGSGNFGHAGRPGQVGGSSPGDVDITFISSMTTPIERTLDRLDMSEANVRSAIASMTRDLPGKWLIEVTPHGPNELSIDGTGIFPEDESGPSGSFSRVFAIDKETGEHFVVHSSFILPESLQNQGHAKLMMRNALETYERMGVSSIDTQAVDVGAYAWARAGFLPTRPQAVERTIKARLTSFEEKGLITSDDYRRLWEASTGSRGLWRVADDPKGKLVLRGMSYDAKLRFKDAAAMRRARHYAGLES